MKVFTTVGYITNHYYIVNYDGVIFASSKPFFDGDNFFKSAFQNESLIIDLCKIGKLAPYNKDAKQFIEKAKHKREMNKHLITVIVCVAIAIGSIFMGVL